MHGDRLHDQLLQSRVWARWRHGMMLKHAQKVHQARAVWGTMQHWARCAELTTLPRQHTARRAVRCWRKLIEERVMIRRHRRLAGDSAERECTGRIMRAVLRAWRAALVRRQEKWA